MNENEFDPRDHDPIEAMHWHLFEVKATVQKIERLLDELTCKSPTTTKK